MSATLVASALTVVRGPTLVLSAVGLTVAPGSRIGVVGPNGAGKSTLLATLAGELVPDSGSVALAPRSATVGLLPQEPDRRPGEVLTAFLARRTGVAEAQTALDEATETLTASAPGADDAYSAALERWLDLGGADLDVRAEQVCADLGLPLDLLDIETSSLSGGQAARASLASVLLSRYDVFLLDEPTNDLDFAGLGRLETFVLGLSAGLVVVSHDREFLARTVTSGLDLDEPSRTATLYGGGYDAYLTEPPAGGPRPASSTRRPTKSGPGWSTRRSASGSSRYAEPSAPSAGCPTTTGPRRVRASRPRRTPPGGSRRSSRSCARLDEVIEPRKEWQLQMEIATAPRSGDVVAVLAGAVVRRGSFTLGPIDLQVSSGERIALVGPNGSGKTTLLQALLGRLPLDSGRHLLGPGVRVGELDQGRSLFRGASTVVEVLEGITDWPASEVRTLLAKYGLRADHVNRPSASLSPGEKTRASLALLQAVGVNLLVLDEPTNHLDLPAIEQLEQALEAYEGTLLLVTHDRRLLEAVRVDRTVSLGSPAARLRP